MMRGISQFIDPVDIPFPGPYTGIFTGIIKQKLICYMSGMNVLPVEKAKDVGYMILEVLFPVLYNF